MLGKRPPCALNNHTLSLSTFGHIHHDTRLVGTHLEGSNFTTTIGYLLQFMKYIQDPSHDCGMAATDKESILSALSKMQLELEQLMDIETKKMSIINQFFGKTDTFRMNYSTMQKEPSGLLEAEVNEAIYELASEIAASLLKNDHVLMPGGWAGLPGEVGHAMCYKFQRDDAGNYTFLIYNTGAGLNFHQGKQGAIEEHAPIKAYRIPAPIHESRLKDFIQQLISPKITPIIKGINTNSAQEAKHRFDDQVIYTEIIPKISFLNGYEIDPTPYFSEYIEGQLSGTCAMRVLMPLLQNEMKDNKRAFKEYLYQLELQSILDLYTIGKNNLNAPEIQRQLRFAIERFARTTLELSAGEYPIVSEARALASRDFIKQIESDLNKALMSPAASSSGIITIQTDTMGLYFDGIKGQGKTQKLMPSDLVREEKKTEVFSMPSREVGESFEEYLRRCNEVCAQNDVNLQSDVLLRDVEQLFLSFPIGGDDSANFWSGLTPEQAYNGLEYLRNITHLYGKHCYLKGGDRLPKRVITSLTGMLVATHLANNYFENDINFRYLADFINSDLLFCHKDLKIMDPYSVTMDPVFDARVSEINEQFSQVLVTCHRPVTSAGDDFYDIQLIDKYNLREGLIQLGQSLGLEKLWDSLQLEHDIDKARHMLYVLANNYKTLTAQGREIYGDILKNLDFCTQFHEYYQECLLFERGGFDYFKKEKSNREVRAAGLRAQDREERHVYLNCRDTVESTIKYSNGVIGNGGRLTCTYSMRLDQTYGMQHPILKDELFAERDEPSYSNAALLRFKAIAESQADGRDLLYHTAPFTRIRDSELRIIATIDFYKQNLEKLNEQDYQTLFLLNLMTPGLLHKQLDSTPELATHLVELLESGLNRYASDKKIEPAAYFCFRASALVYRYLDAYKGKEQQNPEIKAAKEKIQRLTGRLERFMQSVRDKENEEGLKELTRLYLFLVTETTLVGTPFNPPQLKELIASLFFKKPIPGDQGVTGNVVFRDDLENAVLKLYPNLLLQFNQLPADEQEHMLKEILSMHPYNALPIMQTIKAIKIDFPNVKIESTEGGYLNINFKTGNITAPDYSVGYVPHEFYDQDFITYFGTAPIIAKTHLEAQRPFCEFRKDNQNYRVIRDAEGIVHIQKMMAQTKRWMELQDKSNFKFKNEEPYQLLLGDSKYGKYSQEKMGMFIEKDDTGYKVVINKKENYNTIHYEERLPPDFNVEGMNNLFNWQPIEDSDLKEAISTPEVEDFIRGVVLRAGTHFNLTAYPRHLFERDKRLWCDAASQLDYYVTDLAGNYSMALETETKEYIEHIRVKKLLPDGADTGYRLCLPQVYTDTQSITLYDLFSHFESQAFIEVWEKQGDDKSYKIVLPRYGINFLAQKLANGDWDIQWEENLNYSLSLEPSSVSPELSNALILKHRNSKVCLMPRQEFDSSEVKVNEFYNVFLDQDNAIPNRVIEQKLGRSRDLMDGQWNFTNSSHYFSLNLEQDNQVIARTTEECLYLACICLAKHESHKALNYLKRCSALGGLEGRLEEIELIQKIMLDIPSAYSEAYKKAREKNPETSSVRLYAASLMAELKEKRFEAPLTDDLLKTMVSNPNDLNEDYLKIKREGVIQFYNEGFKAEAAENYTYYLKVRAHVPEDMRLDNGKERLFFQSIFKFQNRNDLTTVQLNRYRELKIESLNHRKNILEKRLATNPPNKEVLLRERDAINKKLARNYKYSEEQPKYEVREGLYTVKPRLNIDITEAFDLLEMGVLPLNVSQLSMSVNERDFIASFERFYTLALSTKEEDRAQQDMLKEFVKNTLLSQAPSQKLQDGKSKDYIVQLCSLLAYVLDRPTNAWGRPWHHLNDTYPFSGQTRHWHLDHILTECLSTYAASPVAYVTKIYGSTPEPRSETDRNVQDEMIGIQFYELPILTKHDLCKELGISFDFTPYVPRLVRGIQGVTPASSTEQFIQSELDNFDKDYSQGRDINQYDNLRKKTYIERLKDINVRDALLKSLEETTATQTDALDTLQQTLLASANANILGPGTSLETQLKVAGKSKLPISWEELQLLYLHNDPHLIAQKTKLNINDVKRLLDDMHQYLIAATAQQQRIRVSEHLNKLKELSEQSPDYIPLLIKLGSELNATRCYEPHKHPEILLFEYADNKLLRPQQVQVIEKLTEENPAGEGFNSQVVQLIMGGGKTKILLPILALKKANGTNLSILELPSGAFATNFADLESTTVSAFGRIGHPFIFTRDSACASLNLKALYKKLKNIIEDKQYLMTTAESVEALELKYLEFLNAPPDAQDQSEAGKEKQKEWAQQIKYIEKILYVFKTKGDVIIDEVDSILDPKKELNYSLGNELHIKTSHLRSVQGLYNLFSAVYIALPSEIKTLREVMQNEIMLPDETLWKKAFSDLATQLIDNNSSPLYSDMQAAQLSDMQKDALRAFILQEMPTAKPDFLDRVFSIEAREKIYLMKGELSLHLPNTLRKTANVHYGFPLDSSSGRPMGIAVPYIANNTPSKRAQFGTYYETINYTLQLYGQSGRMLPIATFKEFINDFKTRAKAQMEQSNGAIAFHNTVDALEFAKLTGMDLEALDPNNDELLNSLQAEWSANKELKDFCILNYILKNIKTHPSVLRSNGVNHVTQYRSVQGVTGTPYNARCYHSSLQFNPEDGFGIDGQTVDNFMRNSSEKTIHVPTAKTPILSFAELYDKHPQKVDIHALIDVGAHFKGVGNLEVAKSIYRKLQAEQSGITCVLYYNDADVLCAWNGSVAKEVKSTNMDDIDAITGTKREQRFTYYDQLHTTGTDISQAMNAIGLVTFGKDTLARDFWQAIMRMRDLSGSQTVEVMLSQDIADAFLDKKHWQPQDIVDLAVKNQVNKLDELHFQAAIQKMQGLIREDFLSRLKAIKDPILKARHFELFKELLVVKNEIDPIQQFAGIEQTELNGKKITTQDVLEKISTYYLGRWQTLLTQHRALGGEVQDEAIRAQSEKIPNAFKDIVESTSKICLEHRTITVNEEGAVVLQNQGMAVELKQEKDQDKNKDKEKDLEKQKAMQRGRASPTQYSKWAVTVKEFYQQVTGMFNFNPPDNCLPLKHMLGKEHQPPEFTPAIYVSKNYSQTFNEQINLMDESRKPINAYMVMYNPDNFLEPLKAVILTQEDAEYWKRELESGNNAMNACIVSPANTRVCGNKALLERPEYQKVREQICYFNGDIDILAKGFASSSWLKEDFQNKIDYLDKVILVNFPEKRKWLQVFITTFKKMDDNEELKVLIWELKEKEPNVGVVIKALNAMMSKYGSTERASMLSTLIGENKTLLATALELKNDKVNELLAPFIPKKTPSVSPVQVKTNKQATLLYTNEAKSDLEALLERDPEQAFQYLKTTNPLPSQTEEWKKWVELFIQADAITSGARSLVGRMLADLKKDEFKEYAATIYNDTSLLNLALSAKKPRHCTPICEVFVSDGNFHVTDFSNTEQWKRIISECIERDDCNTLKFIFNELNNSPSENTRAIFQDGVLIKQAFNSSTSIFKLFSNCSAISDLQKTPSFLMPDARLLMGDSEQISETLVKCSMLFTLPDDKKSQEVLEQTMNQCCLNLKELYGDSYIGIKMDLISILMQIDIQHPQGLLFYFKFLLKCSDLIIPKFGKEAAEFISQRLRHTLTRAEQSIEQHILTANKEIQNEFIMNLVQIVLKTQHKESFLELITEGIFNKEAFKEFKTMLLEKLEQSAPDASAVSIPTKGVTFFSEAASASAASSKKTEPDKGHSI